MSCAIENTNLLFKFLEDSLTELFNEEDVKFELLWHSNLLPDNDVGVVRVYINRQIVSETQDTLSVDVVDRGRIRYNTIGACTVNFFIPRTIPNGYQIAERVAQALKNKLRKERFASLWVRNPTARPHNIENNCYRYGVAFSYDFDEII